MKTITKTVKNTLFACLFSATTAIFAQTTVNNNANTAADFDDLQTAIDAATDGDVLYVQHSATTYGNIIITKNLTLIGRSHSDAGFRTTVGSVRFDAGSSNTTLKGFITSSINSINSGNNITDLKFFDNDITGFVFGNVNNYNNVLVQGNIMRSTFTIPTNTTNILINNNIFFSTSLTFRNTTTMLFSNNVIAYYDGPTFSNQTTGLLNIDNCIFIGTSPSAQTVKFSVGSGTIQVNNCITYNYDATGTYTFNTGAGIVIGSVQENTNPLFTSVDATGSTSIASPYGSSVFDPANDDLTLQAGSPVIDDGLFQGYNFKNFGTPTGLPSIKVDSYSSTVPKNSDLTVTITAKTN